MPCDYSKYPPNWKTQIRPAILNRAGQCCEWCGVPNGLIIQRWLQNPAVWRKVAWGEKPVLIVHQNNYDRWKTDDEKWKRPIRIVLTIAHLDHDTTNNDESNLAALCQRCHLRYDARLHAESSARTRKARAT